MAFEYRISACGGNVGIFTGISQMFKKNIVSVYSVFGNIICGGDVSVKKVKGSATVEMAYIMPVVFFTFVVLIYILFYFHDKNIISGAGYETLVVGCQKLRWQEEDIEEQLEKLFRERIQGKMIFFSDAEAEIIIEKKKLIVKACAARKRMRISTEQRMSITRPEKTIRDLRRLEKFNGNKI